MSGTVSSEDEFLTVAEIAAVLKLNQQTVRNWIDAGKLPAVHVGRRVRIRRADFDRMLEQGYSGGRPPRSASEPASPVASAGPRLTGEDFWDGLHSDPVGSE
ncbi:MAG: helix-turn-helix domain-containing protein [Solirubrobacteraceae bacterium]